MRAETPQHNVRYGKQTVSYTLKEHEGNRLKIDVFPDLRVVVQVPKGKDSGEIQARVRQRAGWILKTQREFSKYHPLPVPKLYRSGESLYYLGRQYGLKIVSGSEPSVKLSGGYLWVHTPDPQDRMKVKKQVEAWYREKAAIYLPGRLLKHQHRLGFTSEEEIPVRLRKMSCRWGSCSPSGIITLNPELIKVPSACIDYVLIHELCHLRIHDHSRSFYQLLGNVLPEWREIKGRLNCFGLNTQS